MSLNKRVLLSTISMSPDLIKAPGPEMNPPIASPDVLPAQDASERGCACGLCFARRQTK